MVVLSRIASGLPKLVACTVLPTVVDAAIAINLVNILKPKSANESLWMWGVSTLGGIAAAGLLRTRADMSKIPAGLIYVSWKVYQMYLYRKDHEIHLFFDELKNGNTKSINEYFNNNRDLFSKTNKEGKNALHIFAEKGFDQLVTWILSDGQSFNLNVATSDGWKPLHLAVKCGKLECVKVLLAQNPSDLKSEVPRVGNARSIAFEYDQVEIVKWLDQEKKLLDDKETYTELFRKIVGNGVAPSKAIEWLYQKCADE